MDVDRALAPAVSDRRGRRRDGARSRRERHPYSALPHTDREVVRSVHVHELHVRPLRKARMSLDQRPEPTYVRGITADDSVRIADRDRRELDLLAVEADGLPLPDVHVPNVDNDVVAVDVRGHVALADAQLHLPRAGLASQPGGCD